MKYFYKKMELNIPKSVYFPREDSELLANVLENLDLRGKKCLEMGCGSGLLSIIMSQKGGKVTAVDRSIRAVAAARENATRCGKEVYVHISNLFSDVNQKFDLIVFNPPYLPGEDREKKYKHFYGGPDGRQVIGKFLKRVKNFLKRGGRILIIISTLTGEKEVIELAMKEGFSVREIKRKKIPWEELIVLEMGPG